MANTNNYVKPWIALILWALIIAGSLWINYYTGLESGKYESSYSQSFNILKNNKEEEVNSPIKQIFKDIGSNSSLVLGLSLFHTPPTEIIDEVEKAIYLGKDQNGEFRMVTNENFSFQNYNTINFGLITTDLENYAELIKRLRELYSNTFEISGLKDFGIQRERDEDGRLTGKVFFTTNIQLEYLPGNTNQVELDAFWDEVIEEGNVYENNRFALDTLDNLLVELGSIREAEEKEELYFNSNTDDDSIYLGTAIEYNDTDDIYYITSTNNIIDIFSLNNIGSEDDYATLRLPNIKILFVSKKDGSGYSLCTKVEKEELDLVEAQEKELNAKVFTEIYKKGEDLSESLETFCTLL